MYYENKFKQSLSTIPSISTKRTTTYHATEIIENKKQKKRYHTPPLQEGMLLVTL
jgi:hypothetical protein